MSRFGRARFGNGNPTDWGLYFRRDRWITHAGRIDNPPGPPPLGTLSADLTRVSGVSVLSHRVVERLSSGDDGILDELGVTHLVTGSLTEDGDRYRIQAGLSLRESGTLEWSASYEGSAADLVALQRQAAVSIATALDHELHATHQAHAADVPDQAMRAYLIGRHYWNQRDPESVRTSIRFFEDAIELEPSFARAWAGIADAYTFPGPAFLDLGPKEAYRRALAAARKAQELDPDLAEAYVSSGAIRFVYEWELSKAERDFNHALRLAPSSALAHQWYAELLSATGRHDAAVAHMREARRLDPSSVAISFDLFWVQYMARDLTEALATLDATIALSERLGAPEPTLLLTRARLEAQLDRMSDATTSLEPFYQAVGKDIPPAAAAFIDEPSLQAFRRYRVEALSGLASAGVVHAHALAVAFAELGMGAPAVAWLERASVEKDSAVVWIGVNPELSSLRTDPRFQALAREIGVVDLIGDHEVLLK